MRLLLVLITSAACAQQFSAGIVGGAALSSDFQSQPSPTLTESTSKDYIVGGMLELSLPAHLSLEVDGLYRPMNFLSFTSSIPRGTAPGNTVVTWEFPILAKYRFNNPKAAPFLELGPSFRTAGNLNDTSPSNHGITAGTGVEMTLHKLRILPEFRYTRWAADYIAQVYQPRTNPNQAEVLIGWSFPARKTRRD